VQIGQGLIGRDCDLAPHRAGVDGSYKAAQDSCPKGVDCSQSILGTERTASTSAFFNRLVALTRLLRPSSGTVQARLRCGYSIGA
jgi:hypothetical protein